MSDSKSFVVVIVGKLQAGVRVIPTHVQVRTHHAQRPQLAYVHLVCVERKARSYQIEQARDTGKTSRFLVTVTS